MINVYKILNSNKADSNKLLPLNKSKYKTRGHDRKLEKIDLIVSLDNVPSL